MPKAAFLHNTFAFRLSTFDFKLACYDFSMNKLLMATLLAAGIAVSFAAHAADPKAPEKRATPVKAGELAPDFTLPDQNGRSHTLSAERDKRAVVLVFYRGYW